MLCEMDGKEETRRERLRRELMSDVVMTARSQLESGGPGAVSWRGIAREVGMNPASLYTYFDSLDDVFTAVILDSFTRLGAAMQTTAAAVSGQPPDERLLAGAATYRRWAIDHPAEFNLVFTDQLPNYAAPPDGPTVQAQQAIFGDLARALAEHLESEPGGEPDFDALASSQTGRSTFVGLWATMHGLVMLEINNHLPFMNDHEVVFEATLRRALRSAIES